MPSSETRAIGPVEVELPDGRHIHGHVEPAFEGVLDVFIENFVLRHDVGAACAAFLEGRAIVDLWGGIADARTARPWEQDTTAVIFSCSKGVVAICAYLLAQQGRLDFDAPISAYWPAFAAHGKAAITVRQAMSHRAGLAALDTDLDLEQVVAWDPVIRAIEAQSPRHRPSDGHLYHTMTYGWLVGEVIRRITGSTPGRFLRQELGDPLGLRTWIGLPEEERASVAWMEPPLPDEDSEAAREGARIAREDPDVGRSATMGGAFAFPAEDGFVTFNAPEIQAGEIPGANGISTAESLARLYAACVSDVNGSPLLSDASMDDVLRVRSSGPMLSGAPDDGARWGTGFQLSSPPSQPMLGPGSFGHAGAGGQLAFGDRDHRAGFAFVANQMGGYGDARARELTLALRDALGV